MEDGAFTGVTAAVIVADRGSWAGAAGSLDGTPLTPDSPTPTHSSAKTIVAAQVLRLAEDGMLDLDDPPSDHLPPALRFFDANGATIRQVLAKIPPGSKTGYASTNYVLLGSIVEHATGRPLAEVLRSDVLGRPGLEGIDYMVEDALAGDGYGVESTPASLARWGYELYGGFVLSEGPLREMTDFYEDPCGDFRYGLGAWDLSAEYGTPAVGHEGESSVATRCSLIRLVALAEEGVVISIQANTAGAPTPHPYDEVVRLTQVLRDAALG